MCCEDTGCGECLAIVCKQTAGSRVLLVARDGRACNELRVGKDTHALVTTTHAPAAVRLHELKAHTHPNVSVDAARLGVASSRLTNHPHTHTHLLTTTVTTRPPM
jgi:hypothetical protein